MKKLIGFIAVVFVALVLVSCASTPKAASTVVAAAAPTSGVLFSGNVEKNSFIIADNHTYSKNFQFIGGTGIILPNDYKAKAGDVIKLHMEGKMNKPIALGMGDDNDTNNQFSIQAIIVDTSVAANYWKKLATEWFKITTPINAGEPFTYDMVFTLDADATGIAKNGCANLIIGTNNQQKEAVIISTTKFTYEITRP